MAESKGCSIVVVGVVAVFMLVIGAGIGGAAFWFYAGEMAPAAEPEVVTVTKEVPVETGAAQDYAVLYPLEQTLRVEGPLPEKEVRDRLLAKRFELRKCYQKGLASKPDLKGEMSLQFTVAGSNGKVTAAVERHTKFGDATVKKCILDEVKSWKFSKQSGQSVVKFDVLMLSMSAAEAQP